MGRNLRLAVAAFAVSVAMISTVAVGAVSAGAANPGGSNIVPPVGNSQPVTGGTLKIVGSGDVDHLDTCCAYYTTTYEMLRMVSRQLLSYKASYASGAAGTPVPDMATYTVSPNKLVYTFHIKQGVDWDTPTGPRQVTSADEVRGIKRLCNPVVGAPPITYWSNNIAGMKTYCDAFAKITLPTTPAAQVAALNAFYNANNISGLTTPNSSTVVFTLNAPSPTFLNIMALPMSSPVPAEINNYVPASVTEEENFISDGPYTITSYTPNVSYSLVKNPDWQQSTDPIRHQYFNAVSVTMGETATSVQEQLQTGEADMEWDTTVPSANVPGLVSSKNPGFSAYFFGGLTYLVFNMKSTADGGALQKPAVREALQYCVNKRHIIQVTGGPAINQAINQILPPAMTVGYKEIDPYPSTADEGNPVQVQVGVGRGGVPARHQADVGLRQQSTHAGAGRGAPVGLPQGGGDDQVQRAAHPGCVLRLHRDAVEQGKLGPGLRGMVPGLDRHGGAVVLQPPPRRPPVRQRLDRLWGLQRRHGQQIDRRSVDGAHTGQVGNVLAAGR